MSKKGKKSSISISRKSILNETDPWIKDTKIKHVNDKDFQCSFSILVETKNVYRYLVEEFDKFSRYGYRQCIKCISVDLIKETVFKNCSKNGETSPFSLLCDEVLKYTGKFFEGKIPIDIYKYLIKYIVLELKEKRIIEKKLMDQSDLEYQNKLRPYLNIGVKTGTKNSMRNSTKSGKDTKIQQAVTSKVNTELHTRNTNIRCLANIQDEPENGPDLYIILIQSRHSELPTELIKLDIPLTSLIQVGLLDAVTFDDDDSFKSILRQNLNTNIEIENIMEKSYLEKYGSEKSFLIQNDIRSYWNKILYYMSRKLYSDYFKNVDILRFVPEIPNDPKSPKFIDTIRRIMYDGISRIVFDSVLMRRMHAMHVREPTVNLTVKKIEHLGNLKLYNRIMRNLPQETTTVALILDSIVSQVCNDSNSPLGYDINKYKFLYKIEEKPDIYDNKSCLYKIIEELEYKHRFSDINLTTLRNIDEDGNNNNEECIKVYYNGDQISQTSENLDEEIKEFLKSRNLHILKLFWDKFIWSKIGEPIPTNIYKQYKNENILNKDREELFDILICLTNLFNENETEAIDQKYYVINESIKANENFNKYLDKTLNSFLLKKNIVKMQEKASILDVMTSSVTLQTLEKALDFSSHCKIYYVPINDKIAIVFSDIKIPMKNTVHLPTILPLRDYINEMSNENKFDTRGIFGNKKRFNYSLMLYNKLRSSSLLDIFNKSRSEIICNPKNYHGNKEDWLETYYDDILEKQCKNKYFVQYLPNVSNIYDKIELSKPILYDVKGKVQYDFFDMNIKMNEKVEVFLKYIEDNNSETYDLTVSTIINSHRLCYKTNVLPEGFKVELNDERKCDFFIQHSSGIIFSFVKNVSNHQNQDVSFQNNYPDLEYLKFPGQTNSFVTSNYDYELNISWPNSLAIHHVRTLDLPSYIRQKYINNCSKMKLSKISDESYRCNISNGAVVKFMSNGHLIIFHANGKIITCVKYKKKSYDPPKPNNVLSGKNIKPSLKNTLSEVQELENITFLNYEVRHSDGTIYSIDEELTTEKDHLFVEDIHNVLECSIVTEFSDGIRYKHTCDGSLTVNFLDGTIITSYSKFSDEDIEAEVSNSSLDENYHPEAFTVIELTYKIDHPNYATTVFSYCKKSVILTMPHKIQVTFSNKITINFNEEIEIYNNGKTIVVNQAKHSSIQNEIIVSFNELFDINRFEYPCISIKDSKKNAIQIYDNGKFEVNDLQSIGNKQNERLFIIDKEYSGFEILSKYKMNKSLNKQQYSIIRQIRRERFNDHMLMSPVHLKTWLMYQDFLTKNKNIPEPSTIGSEWYFPFKITNGGTAALPDGISVQFFLEMKNIPALFEELVQILISFNGEFGMNNSYNGLSIKFNDLLLPIQNMIDNPELTLTTFKKGTITLESECELRDSKNFIKNELLYKINQRIFQSRIDKIKIQFQSDKNNILNGNILPYFKSPDGEVSLILNEILENVYMFIDEKRDENELEQLLITPLCKINYKDLKRVEELLIKTEWESFYKESHIIALHKLLEAGKKLQKYFTNIKEVLQFHNIIKSEEAKTCFDL